MEYFPKKILLVEDEAILALLEKRWLQNEGYEVTHVLSGEAAILIVKEKEQVFDLILMDIDLGKGIDGTEAAQEILKENDIPLLFLSSHTEKEIVKKTEKITSFGYVVKGSDETVLLASIKMAFKLYKAYEDLQLKERAFENSQKTLSIILDSFPGLVYWKNKELTYQGSNKIFADAAGIFEPAKINGLNDYDLPWSGSGAKLCQANDKKVIDTGIPIMGIVESLLSSNGETIWYKTSKVPLIDSEGRVMGILGTSVDISEQKKLAEQLLQEKEELRTIIDASPVSIWYKDTKNNFIRVNKAAAIITGRGIAEVEGKSADDIFTLEESAKYYKDDLEVINSGKSKIGIIESATSTEGLITWVRTDKVPWYDKDHNISGIIAFAQDITEQKKNIENLIEIENTQRNLFNSIRDAIVVTDNERHVLDCNPAFTSLFGYGLDEIKNKDTLALYESESVYKNLGIELQKNLNSSEPYMLFADYKKKNGEVFSGEGRMFYLKNYKDEIIGFVGIIRDISDRKKIEETQLFLVKGAGIVPGEDFFKSLARYLAENLNMDYVCIDRLSGDGLNAKTMSVFYNGEFEDNIEYTLFDTPCAKVVQKSICCFPDNVYKLFPNDQIIQDMKAESYAGITLWSAGGKQIGLIAMIGRSPIKRKSLVEAVLKLAALRASGELERCQAEEALIESETKLKEAQEIALIGRWDYDILHDSLLWSDSIFNIYEVDPKSFKPSYNAFMDSVYPDDREDVEKSYKEALLSKKPFVIQHRLKMKDGRVKWVNEVGQSIYNNEGNPVKSYGIVQDITERKFIETQLEKSAEELKSLNTTKDKFISILAHDLRGPFAGFMGMTNELKTNINKIEKEDIVQYAELMHTSSTRIYGLLTNLLEWSRLQTGRMEYNRGKLDLFIEIENIKYLFSSVSKGKDILIRNEVPSDTFVYADENMLLTILRNLISNAIKFTKEKGEISITSNPVNEFVEVTIKDNGIGMSNEVLKKIFRIDSSFTTTGTNGEEGSGLGLVLCKDLVKKNNGDLSVASQPDMGSTFTFTLPLA